MSRANKIKIGSHWSKPPTKIYGCNYDFQEGYYRPMVDYLDKRDRGVGDSAPPGAQTIAERIAANRPKKKDTAQQILEGIPFHSTIGSRLGEHRPSAGRLIGGGDDSFGSALQDMMASPEAGFGDEDPFSRSRNRRSLLRPTPDVEADEFFSRAAGRSSEMENMMQEMGMEKTKNKRSRKLEALSETSNYNLESESTSRKKMETISERQRAY